MEKMEIFSVKMCWGNFAFDYVHSDSVGNSGGILCVWDPSSYRKKDVTVSDYFIMIRGVWLKTGCDLLIVSVYAPQELNEKKMLWDYLTHVINNWKGEVIIMGDFNEVRCKSERFGSNFNVQGANVFNSFIVNAGLEEIPLGGCSFTWCHKSATKMSKLDRFLISENLMITCPNFTATSLERYLSDHRPILLRESHFDYGPTPFRFFHSWFEMEGFNKLVEDAWNEAPVDESNAMSNMMKKLKYLKQKIRDWNKGNMKSSKNIKAKLKDDLKAVDDIIDNGEGNDEVVKLRMDVLKSIQDIDKIQSLDAAQKAKIKWSIEGDENSSFYHGVLNKKRSQLNIRGILVDGTWVDNPQRVKNEFLHHFSKRFDKPAANRASLVMNFSKILSCDQQVELELEVSKDEVKRAVWDCGTDKAPGPDGFTFGFYRRFWKVIENDVFDAVNHFFTYGDIPKGCNSSFIALIPKIPDANVVKDFRPISLIGSLYKIIAKILANRLVVVLGDIVNEGLHFQHDKSKLMGVLVDDEKVKQVASKLGCLILKPPFSYLGSKVGGSMHRIQAWNEVVDRVYARLSKWKMKTLSIGGRLESIRSYFFNGHDPNSKRTSWGGLMFKWVWRFFTQNTSLWSRVIKAIHGEDGKVGKQVKSAFPSYWMDIVHEINVLKNQGINLLNCMQNEMGTTGIDKLLYGKTPLDWSYRS
ncbi:RNA-directed DNA polymerase, eukaryota [Tanacetum coccineum]